MKTLLLTSLLIVICLICNSQEKKLYWTVDKKIITSISAGGLVYGFTRKDLTYKDHKLSVEICTISIVFGGLYLALRNNDNFEVNASGINYNLKFDRKYRKCIHNPFRK